MIITDQNVGFDKLNNFIQIGHRTDILNELHFMSYHESFIIITIISCLLLIHSFVLLVVLTIDCSFCAIFGYKTFRVDHPDFAAGLFIRNTFFLHGHNNQHSDTERSLQYNHNSEVTTLHMVIFFQASLQTEILSLLPLQLLERGSCAQRVFCW